MNNVEVNMTIGIMLTSITKLVSETLDTLNKDFEGESSNNERVNIEADLYNTMNQYMVYTVLNSFHKKMFDKTKKDLDYQSGNLGLDADGVPDHTHTIASIGDLTFSKKQNKNGTTTLVTDLVIALARVGVEKSIVDDAIKQATKVKRGNVYYQVEARD